MLKFLKLHEKTLLVGLLILASLLRLPLLNGSFWLDEAAQALESTRSFVEQANIVPDFQPPLMHYLVHFAAQVSVNEWWLRLWGSLIPGLVTIWATYQLGKRLFNERVALVASLLLATSSFHIFFSQELRPYSLSAMWGILSTLLLLSPNFQWWKFALLSLAGLYTSYLYPFLLLPQLWLLWRQQDGRRRLLKIVATVGVLFAPWLPMFFQQLNAGQNLRAEIPGWEAVVSLPQLKALALVPLKFIYGVVDLTPSPFFIISALLIAGAVSLSWRRPLKLDEATKKIGWLLLGSILLSWLVSFIVPVVQPKRLLFLLPLFYLLAAVPLQQKQRLDRLAWLLPAVLLLLNLWGIAQYWTQPSLQRENWRDLKMEVISQFPAQDTIAVFSFDEAFAPWRWYWPGAIASLPTGQRYLGNVSDLSGTLRPITNYRYVLVFDYLRTLTDPDDQLLSAIESFGFVGRGVIDYPGIGFVRIYTLTETTLGYRL